MALANKSKPNHHYRKRVAQHHRQSKSYLKTYWPYLPLFAVLAGGAVLNRDWAISSSNLANDNASASASRIQILTGSNSSWLTLALLSAASVSLIIYLIMHSLRLQRVIVRGEDFINKHPFYDIVIVLIFTTGFVLSNSPAIIR